MAKNTNDLIKKAEELFNQKKFDAVITLLTDKELEKQKNAKLYAWKAIANYKLGVDNTVTMLWAEKAIETDSKYYMGYFVRACVWMIEKKYDKAKADYDIAIDLNPEYAEGYYYRGLVWQSKKEKEKAIVDFDKAINCYKKAIENNPNDEDLYLQRGIVKYYKGDYHEAIDDYTKVIDDYTKVIDDNTKVKDDNTKVKDDNTKTIKSDLALTYYNRGLAKAALKDPAAIKDFKAVIKIDPDYKDVYVSMGNIKKVSNQDYDGAIADYAIAIEKNQNDENAYYQKGLANYEKALKSEIYNIETLEESNQDFKKYIELTTEENDNSSVYAKQYIAELTVLIQDSKLWHIKRLINNIKDTLLIRKDDGITHYTSLSVLKELVFDNSSFQISEGNFMNDPSEGKELFKFLKYKPDTFHKDNHSIELVSFKPFIGSFVTKNKSNILNLWRLYGKQKGEEAKGCTITIDKQKFIDDIKDFLSDETNKEARLNDESDINFYCVAYIVHNGKIEFYIPNSKKQSGTLTNLIKDLKIKIEPYTNIESSEEDNRFFLEKYLNSIAFLFKNDAYKNEDEIRLVMDGIEFKKKCNMIENSPRVYIELVPVKNMVSLIILGPKVDKVNDWKAAVHYSYENKKVPEIKKSQVPFK